MLINNALLFLERGNLASKIAELLNVIEHEADVFLLDDALMSAIFAAVEHVIVESVQPRERFIVFVFV